MTKLSDTQAVILGAAAQHEMGLATPPRTLPAAARNAVFRSLIKNNLLTEISAPRDYVGLGWRQDDDGTWIVVRITDDGLRAIGIDPNEGDAVANTAPIVTSNAAVEESPTPRIQPALAAPPTEEVAMLDRALAARATTSRNSLRGAALATVAAWEAQAGLEEALRVLKAEMIRRGPAGCPGGPRKAREGTKQEAVLTLLRRDEGATIAQVMEATGWAQHTVRGFFASLKKKGYTIEVLERVKQVGTGKQGAKGSFSIYHVISSVVAG